jgi:hypothetical protein
LQAQRELSSARAEVDVARSVDAAADRQAFAAGESLAKQRALPKAEEAAAAAQRAYQAAESGYADMQYHLAKLIHKHRTSWLPAQEQVVAHHRDAVLDALSHVTDAYDAFVIEAGILAGLTSFPEQGSLVAVAGFGDISPFEQKLKASIREADAEDARRKHGGSMMAPRDFGSLVGALRRLVQGGTR